MAIKHTHTAIANEVVASSYWNDDHTIVQTDIDHNQTTNTHNLTTDLTPAWANVSDKPASAVAEIDDAVNKKHTQNTDTALGSGAEAADHGAAATDQIINVSYGTGDPPAAATTTEGSLFIKYTA